MGDFGVEITSEIVSTFGSWMDGIVENRRLAGIIKNHTRDWYEIKTELILPTPVPIDNVGSLFVKILLKIGSQ